MKKLSIIVRSEKLDDVKAILDECGSTGATVSNIMGYGNQKGYKTTYRGSEYVVNLIPKIKIETIVKDDVADNIIFKVCEKISTGKSDGCMCIGQRKFSGIYLYIDRSYGRWSGGRWYAKSTGI